MQTSPEVNFPQETESKKKLSPIGDIKCDHYRAKIIFFLIVFGVIYLISIVKQEKAKTARTFQVLIGFTPSRGSTQKNIYLTSQIIRLTKRDSILGIVYGEKINK